MSVTELQGARSEKGAGDDRVEYRELHARRVLRDRLAAAFPSESPVRIGRLIDDALARTAGARVQAFRVLLAERDVRAMLQSESQSLRAWP